MTIKEYFKDNNRIKIEEICAYFRASTPYPFIVREVLHNGGYVIESIVEVCRNCLEADLVFDRDTFTVSKFYNQIELKQILDKLEDKARHYVNTYGDNSKEEIINEKIKYG